MANVNISEFIPTIKSILKDSDPSVITAKDVRLKLQQKFKIDLTPRKQEVQDLIERCYDDLSIGSEEIEPKVPKKPRRQNSNSEEKSKKSSSDKPIKKPARPKGRPPKTQAKIRESDYSSLEDGSSLSPPQKKKRGRKPKGSVKAESSDAEYERKFEEELLNATSGKKSKPKSNSTASKKKSNKRKKRDDDDDGEEPKKRKKRNTGIHKPLILSAVLAEFLQAAEMSRLEVVKRLWAYIKENELQDPNDKRFIVCDDKLMGIFKQNRIHSFTMNKFLTVHLKKKETPADADVKSANGTTADNDENRHLSSVGEDPDDTSRDEDAEDVIDVKVKVEHQEDWENLDNEDDNLSGEEEPGWVKPEEDDD